MSDKRPWEFDWETSPPFITSTSGIGELYVTVKVHSMDELHAAHDLVLDAFKRVIVERADARWRDANQG